MYLIQKVHNTEKYISTYKKQTNYNRDKYKQQLLNIRETNYKTVF